jgi:ABC-type transport system substrate-binding protein
MLNRHKYATFSLLVALSLLLAACQPGTVVQTVVVTEMVEVQGTPQVVEKVVERVVTPTPEAPKPVVKPSLDQRAQVVRLAVLSDIDGTNVWYLYDTTGSSYWNYVVHNLAWPQLYQVSDQRWDFIPLIADGMPGEFSQEGDLYAAEVKIKEDAVWSDGTPVTADDVAFTANTVLTFALSGNWVSYYNPDLMVQAEAVDAKTVKFYFNILPGIPVWQYGALQGPIINKTYWEPKIAELLTQAQQLDREAADFLDKITPLQQTLEALPNEGEPIYGPFQLKRWEVGAYSETTANNNWLHKGLVVEEYKNGAYREMTLDNKYEFVEYGEPAGEKALEFQYGQYFDTVLYPVYSQDAALLALQNNEVDMILNPSGLSIGAVQQLQEDPTIRTVQNAQNGFRYIEFNQARPYLSGEHGIALRQAIACQLDLDFLANNVLQGSVKPVYTLVPPGLTYYHNPDVPIFCKGMTAEERLNEATAILKKAGFTWDQEPAFIAGSAREEGAVYGEGLKLPDGTVFPEITLQAPAPGYDPLRATSAVYLEQWMRQLGIPVTAEYTPFNTIRANENSGEFDIIMLGWGLTPFPSYVCDFFTGATGVGDGSDNIGYVSPKLNEQCNQLYEATELEKARQIVFDIQVTLATELPYITIFTNPIYDAYRNIEFPFTEVFDGLQGIYGAAHMIYPAAAQ